MENATGRRVLVIDDDVVDREMIERALATPPGRFEPCFACDARTGRKLLDDSSWDCVLLDYRLPEGDAFELFADILQHGCASRPPIVLLTGQGGERVAVDALKRGVQDYVNKRGLSAQALHETIEGAIAAAAVAIEEENRSTELLRLSMHDALTGLPNRALFSDRLETQIQLAERRGERFAVMMIDLDRFKAINDRHGHHAGDCVLQAVSNRLRGALRQSDTVARLGGDEFAAVLVTAQDAEGAVTVADKLATLVDAPIDCGDEALQVGASVGIALWPEHGRDRDTLLRHADAAMYRAKREGLGYAVYQADDHASDQRPVREQPDTLAADDFEQFEVHYQPQIDLRTGELFGREALLRWHHPVLGLLPPVPFLSAAGRGDGAWAIGKHLINSALNSWLQWNEAGIGVPVTVNVPLDRLQETEFVSWLVHSIERLATPPGTLTIKVPAPGMMARPERLQEGFTRVSTAGITVAVDQFGACLAPSDHAATPWLSVIKLDRTLIQMMLLDPGLARELHPSMTADGPQRPRLVADGVDSRNAIEQLRTLGVEAGQGPYFCDALDAAKCFDWCRRWQAGGVTEGIVVSGDPNLCVVKAATVATRDSGGRAASPTTGSTAPASRSSRTALARQLR